MVAFKAAQTPPFIENPDFRYAAALVYGPDSALVAERARDLAKNISAAKEPEAELIRLDDRDLSEDPDRLAVELQTHSMFAEHRIVHVKAERRLRPEDISELIASGLSAILIVEAGNLRPSSKLRKLFEASEQAIALPCYADAAKDISRVIDRELGASGLEISREVRAYLESRLGGGTGLARSECAKLATYVGDTGTITVDDIDAVIGDLGAGMFDSLASAVAERKAGQALSQLDALLAGGTAPAAILTILSRHFQRLHRLCAAVDAGEAASRAAAQFRPPLHFKQRDALLLHVRRWSEGSAARALSRVQNTIRNTRRTPALERELTSQLIVELTR
ncbi:MAG: DNA polymerase III subunit delta [Hyphomicrobiaceae bacterium]|nr:DNA polymerase III subunit delta [Hyphomicrobiaceae bacterium]